MGTHGNHVQPFEYFGEMVGAGRDESLIEDAQVFCSPARPWMSVTSRGRSVPAEKIAERLRINPEFAQKVYDIIQPGTTVIITDQPVVRSRGTAAILEG